MPITNVGNVVNCLMQYITEAVNADGDEHSPGYARILELPVPDGSQATVLILSGGHHDLLVEFVENNFRGATRGRVS